MEQTIVLENLDETSTTWLEQEAGRLGLPIDQVIARLIRQAIENAQVEAHHDLDHLAGTWSDEEAQELLDIVAEMDSPLLTRWSNELSIEPRKLRQALMLGLDQLRKQQQDQEIARQAVEALLNTGRARRLPALPEEDEPRPPRRPPLKLPGTPVSEILIAQRRGEL
jgi:hypothetical protein